jgi:hypothetical protein
VGRDGGGRYGDPLGPDELLGGEELSYGSPFGRDDLPEADPDWTDTPLGSDLWDGDKPARTILRGDS